VVGGERERGGNGVRACVVLPFLPALLCARKRKAEERKKPIPNFLLLAPHDRSTVTAKSQKLNLFFLPKHSGFFLTAARCSERSQAGRDSNGCGCRRVPTADEWSPPSRVGGRGRARPCGRSVVDILHCKGFAVSSVMWYDPT
jgi:hypothetical protein